MAEQTAKPSWRDRLLAFYGEVAPEKAANVDKVLEKYAGQEERLASHLEMRYKREGFFRNAALSFGSPIFDAQSALFAPRGSVPLPAPDAPVFDNIRKCRVLVRMPTHCLCLCVLCFSRIMQLTKRLPQLPKSSEYAVVAARPAAGPAAPAVRVVPTEEKAPRLPARKAPGILDVMMEKLSDGPFGVLRKCLDEKARVRVMTRRIAGVRGTCTGYLRAFDKHMNMVLIDVDEDYLQVYFEDVLVDDIDASPRSLPKGWSRRTAVDGTVYFQHMSGFQQVEPPERPRIRKRRVEQEKSRHLKQVLIRGDCVISVARVIKISGARHSR